MLNKRVLYHSLPLTITTTRRWDRPVPMKVVVMAVLAKDKDVFVTWISLKKDSEALYPVK